MLTVDNNTFKTEVLESKTVVLVDFWAVGCGPCRMLEPRLKTMEPKFPGVKFVKIEAGEALDVFKEYGISSVPTLILFKEGKAVGKKQIVSDQEITEWLTKGE